MGKGVVQREHSMHPALHYDYGPLISGEEANYPIDFERVASAISSADKPLPFDLIKDVRSD